MWSVGCIFGELLSMMKENCPNPRIREALFPGKSCYPFSPDKKSKETKGGFPHSVTDQMALIFKLLGIPNDEDKSFIANQKALQYVNSFTDPTERITLKQKYPAAPQQAIDLLERIMVFNPYFRISVDDALKHPFFAAVRNPHHE